MPKILMSNNRDSVTNIEFSDLDNSVIEQALNLLADKEATSLRAALAEIGGPTLMYNIWKRYYKDIYRTQDRPCHGTCQDLTEHYVIFEKATCTICGEESRIEDDEDDDDENIFPLANGQVEVYQHDLPNPNRFGIRVTINGVQMIHSMNIPHEAAINEAKLIAAALNNGKPK